MRAITSSPAHPHCHSPQAYPFCANVCVTGTYLPGCAGYRDAGVGYRDRAYALIQHLKVYSVNKQLVTNSIH